MDSFYAPRFDIRVSGLTLSAEITNQVISVTYDNNLDLADMFTVVMRNPDNKLLDSALFDLGKTVEIHIGYGNDLQPMMLGDITSIQPSFPESGPPTIALAGYDKSYKLRHNQPDRKPYRYVTDSVIAAQIAGEAGLIPIVDPSPIFHQKKLMQTGCDMAFLKERARANFFDVYVHWDRLYFQLPRQAQAYVLEWGKSLSSYSPRISNTGLAGMQVIRGYSEELAQTIVASAMAADFDVNNIVEKLGSSALDLLLSMGRRLIHNQPVESDLDALTVAKSILQELLEGLYEGSGSCIGIPDLRAGRYVSIQGVGKRFSGTYRLRKVTHVIDDSGYRTRFEVTQRSGASFLQLLRKTIQESPPPNEQEKFYGVVIAKVTNNAELMDGSPGVTLGRVQVQFPWLSDSIESGWARCVTPMAGDQMGVYFLPEVGDEVLVAFEHGIIHKPVVLGGVWNGKKLPPVTNDGFNNVRMIKSRSGHTITLDDTKGLEKVIIKDSNNNTVTLDRQGITLSDLAGSRLELKTFKTWLEGFTNVFQTWTPIAQDGGAALNTAMSAFLKINPVPMT